MSQSRIAFYLGRATEEDRRASWSRGDTRIAHAQIAAIYRERAEVLKRQEGQASGRWFSPQNTFERW